jgi:predicted DNA-binding transcriptional regulator YafY
VASRSSKRSTFQRILNDMLMFSPEQLVMIKLGQKVLRAKRSLKSAADEAQQFVDSLKPGAPKQQVLEFEQSIAPRKYTIN